MYITAFVVGFFTAIGWWSANKVTGAIDTPQKIEKPAENNNNKE